MACIQRLFDSEGARSEIVVVGRYPFVSGYLLVCLRLLGLRCRRAQMVRHSVQALLVSSHLQPFSRFKILLTVG